MADAVYYSRSHGISASGVADQYADGKAAEVWHLLLGEENSRTENYKDFLLNLLKKRGCHKIFDIACGTGIDSMLLLEAGFDVTSVDASDKMLKYALESRWERRKDPRFDRWIIKEANWITLYEDCKDLLNGGFDAIICLGNSFSHLLDSYGDQREQRQAIANFEKCLKPGGLLVIDHRNFDSILGNGATPRKSIYYNSTILTGIETSVQIVNGKPRLVTLDYNVDVSVLKNKKKEDGANDFRLSYYPHTLDHFREILLEAFGKDANIKTYGDFQDLDIIKDPVFYIHIVEKIH